MGGSPRSKVMGPRLVEVLAILSPLFSLSSSPVLCESCPISAPCMGTFPISVLIVCLIFIYVACAVTLRLNKPKVAHYLYVRLHVGWFFDQLWIDRIVFGLSSCIWISSNR